MLRLEPGTTGFGALATITPCETTPSIVSTPDSGSVILILPSPYDQLFDAPGIDIADMLKGDSGETATTEDGKCARCEELRKAVDGHERRAGHMVQEKELV